MKKIISTIMLLAAAATAFTSCDKQNAEATQSPEESVLVFTSEKPSFDDDVKTEWNEIEKTVYWSAGDKILMAYTITPDGGDPIWQGEEGANNADGGAAETPALYTSTAWGESSLVASFNVPTSFDETPQKPYVEVGKYDFYTLYPSSSCKGNTFASKGYGIVNIAIPTTQTYAKNSFDSASDIMVGKSVNEYYEMPTEGVPVMWNRVVAHAYITLKEIKGVVSGEVVNTITLTAQDGAELVGNYTVDLTDGTLESRTGGADKNILNINVDSKVATLTDNNISFWAIIKPCTLTSLNVVVDTDKATYTRNIDLSSNQKTFLQNRRNLLTINMADAVRTPKAVSTAYYEKVTSAPADWSGTYLIVCEDENIAMNGSLTLFTVSNNFVAVTINEGKIGQTTQLDNSAFIVTVDGADTYKLQSLSGYYIGCKGTSFNAAKSYKSDTHANYITYDADKSCVYIKGLGNYLLQYNSASNSNRFSYFSAEKKSIQLYKRSEDL